MNDYVGQNVRARPSVQDEARDLGLKRFLLGIYQKMALGLLLTGATAWAVAHTPALLQLLYVQTPQGLGYSGLGYVFLFAPVVMSFLSGTIMRNMNVAALALFYWAFVAIMGVSLSSIFLLYTATSLASTFFITAAAFGALSIYGYTTKTNMTGWGSFLMMAVFGIIIASLVNVFLLKSGMFDLFISAAGVLIFSGLLAYQTQQLKQVYYSLEHSATGLAAMTYYGALSLYINFINLFLSILRLFGGDRR